MLLGMVVQICEVCVCRTAVSGIASVVNRYANYCVGDGTTMPCAAGTSDRFIKCETGITTSQCDECLIIL
jgi:hypothetical protein